MQEILMKIAYVTDSGTGRSIEDLANDGILSLPLQITSGTVSFQDMENLSKAECIQLLQDKKILLTSQPSLGLVQDLFASLQQQHIDLVIAVPICNGLSGTLTTMTSVAREMELKLIAYDTYCTAVVQDYLVHRLKQAYEDHMDGDDINLLAQEIIESCETIVIPSDLMHLARGGRLTTNAARFASLLRITPILHLNQQTGGKIDMLDKVISLRRAMKRVVEHLHEKPIDEHWLITIAHVNAIDNAQTLYHMIQEEFPKASIQIIALCNAVAAHTGLGSICVQYFKRV